MRVDILACALAQIHLNAKCRAVYRQRPANTKPRGTVDAMHGEAKLV